MSDLYQIFCACYLWHGSVLFLRRRRKYMDDIILMHKPRQLNAAAQLIGAHAALDLAINGMWEFPLRANGLTGLLFGHHSLGLVGRSGHVEYS